MDGFCKEGFLVPHFVDPLSAARKLLQLCPYISNIYDRKRGIGKKLILTIRAVMLGEHVGPGCGRFQWGCVAVQQ